LSFGGGGSGGTTGVNSHTHDSAVGNGGNLSSTITNLDSGLINTAITLRAITLG
tara:strand:- start:735 stop:896 length:162 start_codon:yes stop_codon:yes gene_type:complete